MYTDSDINNVTKSDVPPAFGSIAMYRRGPKSNIAECPRQAECCMAFYGGPLRKMQIYA